MEQTLTILGATGYTGRLCVTEAVRRGQPIVIAGRRREALEEIAAAHADSGVPMEVAVADVGDPDALRELAERSTTLLSTVGPYTKLGQGPVQACIESGCHYVDVTGEVEFMTWVYAQSERAAAKGVTLATGSGFDGVPGDLLAAMAAQALDRPVHSARVAYHVENARVSAGTARSALGALNRGGAVWRSGRVAQEPAAVEQWQVPFPEPQGPTLAVSAPLPEVVTVGRSIGADVVRAYFVIPAGRAVSSIAGPAQRVAALLSTTPLWGLLERGIDRLPDGPTAAQRAKTRTLVLAEVTGEGGVAAVQWATLNELYGATAVIAISAAQKLLEGTVPTGAVTPSTLFDAATLFAELGAEVGPP
jgi:saccharopine dehydrogenase (NAD+, L-lysine-forming)